jgi:hypothetical protein
VAEVQQHRADHATEGRAQQLSRWHADDQAAALQSQHQDRQGLALTAEGGGP